MKERPGVRTTLDEGVLLVELDRLDQRNALDESLQHELLELFLEAGHEPEVRGVVLTGSGEAFSAGGDLSRFEKDWNPAEFRAHSHELTRLISSIERLEKPVVAAINGLATGAGTQLALSCDLRVASEKARFLFREGMIGFIPSHGGCVRLVKLVGLARARDILLGGEDLDAQKPSGTGSSRTWSRMRACWKKRGSASGTSSGGRRRLTVSVSGSCTSRPAWTWRAASSRRAWRRACW